MFSGTNRTDDELVSQFMAFTGSADSAKAASYLEMSGGNLETAVGLFMEHENAQRDPVAGTPQEVRAPDETRRMQLMGGGDPLRDHLHGGLHPMAADPSFQMMNAMMEEQLSNGAFGGAGMGATMGTIRDVRAAINAAAAMGGDDDEEEEKMDIAEDSIPPTSLNEMFMAPNHLIHRAGGFQGARAMAKDTKRWLLVNIQRDSEFSSHALNRDVWRDELVENLIREGFIFWQQADIHPEGRTYVERYGVHDFPHVGILDPRTGRLMLRREGWTQQDPLTAETFAELAMDFCSRNSFDKPPKAPRPRTGGPSASRSSREMSEDEQLQAAMKASMEDVATSSQHADQSIEYIADSDEEAEDMEDKKVPAAAEASPSMVDQLLAFDVGEEPSSGARLRIRMPDGKTIVRRFGDNAAIKTLYAFVVQNNKDAKGGKDFALFAGYPPSDLAGHDMDSETVSDCKLSGQVVNVRWKD